jgi:prevent-host-death family protein
MTMIMVNIYEAKAKLSEYVEAVGKGERVLICRHNRPVAELRPVMDVRTEPRDLAPMFPGATFMTPAFFEPLSRDDLDAWEGLERGPATKVAESRAEYSAAPRRRSTRRARR